MSTRINVMSLYLVYFQTTYQMRPHCHIKEKFFDKWCDNIKDIGLSKDDEETMLVHAILAFKQSLKKRQHYSNLMLDFIHKIAKREFGNCVA